MSSFTKAERDSPNYPNETCPDINEVGENIDNAVKNIQKELDILDGMTGSRSNLELLRTQNEQLRESAVFWREKAQEFSDMISKLEANIEELEESNSGLVTELALTNARADAFGLF